MIKTYSQFLNESKTDSQFLKTHQDVENWLWLHNIQSFTINENLTVDVKGDVSLSYSGVTKLEVQFRRVIGNFSCDTLHTLKGCPEYVEGNFHSHTKENNLKYSPKVVRGDFAVTNTQTLTSLEGAPLERDGMFWCNRTGVTSLVFAPNLYLTMSPNKDNIRYWNTPCEEIYDRLGFNTEAHVEALINLDPNPKDTLSRLEKVYPGRYKEIMLNKEMRFFLGLESAELTNAYQISKDVDTDFY